MGPDPNSAFSCRIRAEWLAAEAVPFGSRLNHAFTFSHEKREGIEIQALFGPTAYRLDAAVNGRETREISVIAHATGELLWLDHHLRVFVRIDPESLPSKRMKASMRVLEAPAPASDHEGERLLARTEPLALDAPQVVRTTIEDGSTHCAWTHYLVCDPAQRASPAVLEGLLAVLVGDRELQALAGFPWRQVHKLVSKAGLPIAGGVCLAEPGSDPQSGSTFRLDGIEDNPAPKGRLDVPANYKSAFDFGFNGLDRDKRERITYHDPRDPPPVVPVHTPTPPPPAGQAAVIGLWIPQSALNTIRQTFNQLVRPLSGFRVASGKVKFDWLAQLRSHWLDKQGGGGTLVYCALRDEPLPAPGAPTPARWRRSPVEANWTTQHSRPRKGW